MSCKQTPTTTLCQRQYPLYRANLRGRENKTWLPTPAQLHQPSVSSIFQPSSETAYMNSSSSTPLKKQSTSSPFAAYFRHPFCFKSPARSAKRPKSSTKKLLWPLLQTTGFELAYLRLLVQLLSAGSKTIALSKLSARSSSGCSGACSRLSSSVCTTRITRNGT